MAQEGKRGCGYRIVGGLYLVGGYIAVPCDRLPYPLDVCPVCGSGIKVGRGCTKVNPLKLFGAHHACQDEHHPCNVCDPTDGTGFIMRVGEKYYPTIEDFSQEALTMGVSKRIPFIPKELELGITPVFLAHPKAIQVVEEPSVLVQAHAVVADALSSLPSVVMMGVEEQKPLVEAPKVTYKLGIFAAFIPHRVEKLIWQHDATEEELEKLEKRGITPVVVKDGDLDHARGMNK